MKQEVKVGEVEAGPQIQAGVLLDCTYRSQASNMTLLVGSIFHVTRKIVSEMTYNVSMGTLNPTIPYLE